MDAGQFETLRGEQDKLRPVHLLDHLSDLGDRTLIYGYTHDRNTFHVYLSDGMLCRTVYNSRIVIEAAVLPKEMTFEAAGGLVPDKRVYPAASDYQFCSLLQRLGITIPFTLFGERQAVQYHGETIESLGLKPVPDTGLRI